MIPIVTIYVILAALAVRWGHFWQMVPLTFLFFAAALVVACDRGDDAMAAAPIAMVLFGLTVVSELILMFA